MRSPSYLFSLKFVSLSCDSMILSHVVTDSSVILVARFQVYSFSFSAALFGTRTLLDKLWRVLHFPTHLSNLTANI